MLVDNQIKSPVFFLGCTSPDGFYSCFDNIYFPENGDRLYILKGGPGTGKSTFMRNVANEMNKIGVNAEYGICSCSPDSLDAVIFGGLKTAIADGTAPHVMEPKYPGACERLVDLGGNFNCDFLEKNLDILYKLFNVNSELQKKASRYIAAAGSLIDDSYSIDCECTDFDRVFAFAKRLSASVLKPKEKKEKPEEKRRLLSAVTSKGYIFLQNTINVMCDEIFEIEDENGATSSAIMTTIRSEALKNGYDIITCPCPFAPLRKIDHIIIPSLRTAFCTTNQKIKIENSKKRRIHSKRFQDTAELRNHRPRLNFNRRAVQELTEGATKCLSDAKTIHDEIEKYYVKAMDFDGVRILCDRTINELKQRII